MTSKTKMGNGMLGGTLLGHIAAIVTVAMWGYSFVSSKVLLDNGLGPVHIYFYRFVLAYLMVLFISHKRLWASNWRDEGLFVVCALTSGSLYFIAENTALQYTLTTTWLGSAIAVAGVACVVFNSSTSLEVRPLGDFLALAAAFSWAFYSLILRRLNAHYDVWFITRKTFFYGILTSIPFLIFEPESQSVATIISRPEVYANLLFLGLGASTIAYVLWAYTVKTVGAVKANNYMYLQSIVTLIVSAIVLGEHVNFIGYLGIFLILAGLWAGDNINKLLDNYRKK